MYVADYVLLEYGTGAVMVVPAHDERDFEFATAYDIEIRRVIDCGDLPCTEDGPMVNSGRFYGLNNREAYEQIKDLLGREMLDQRTPEEQGLLNGYLVKPVSRAAPTSSAPGR